MSAEIEPQSRVLRWFDTFLQEQNIRWILALGMLILLGSSLMLVTSHWESYDSHWRLGILLGYTAGVHFAGQVVYRSLGLRKTGTGLMALTVMLIPLSFHALRWMHPQEVLSTSTLLEHGFVWVALIANTVFASLAAKRLFDHFLRGTQPTFIAAYVVLCIAGCIVPALPVSWAPITALVLWAVFAVGATKVNRHVFWLTVEHRLPRIFGFFPIALLGLQFLTLFGISLVPHVSLPLIGVGVVLTAIPVLLTADALARVFLEVEGRLTRPLPWSIVLPMFIGLVLSATGVCLAATTFPETQALVPAAALSALTMGVVAYRTERRGFVWAMLAGMTLAYQSTPSFFRELTQQVIQQGAVAVQEPRLPLAFYGLTYLPLLMGLSVWAARRRNADDELFTPVVRQFVTGMGTLLLTASLSHPKAVFPVSIALSALFLTQAFLFRQVFLLVLAVGASLLACTGAMTFLQTVCGVTASTEAALTLWGLAATALLWPGRLIDRRALQWRPADMRTYAVSWCEVASLTVTSIAAAIWAIQTPNTNAWFLFAASGAVLLAILTTHALLRKQELWAAVALLFAVACPAALVLGLGWSPLAAITLAAALCAVLWVINSRFNVARISPALKIFQAPAAWLSECGLMAATLFVVWPVSIGTLVFALPFSAVGLTGITLLWNLHCAARSHRPWSCFAAWLSLMLAAGAAAISVFGVEAQVWLPALWTTQAVLGVFLVRPVAESTSVSVESNDAAAAVEQVEAISPWQGCVFLTLALFAYSSLFVFTLPMRVAAGIAFVGLILLAARRRSLEMRRMACLIANWQVLCVGFQCVAPQATSILKATHADCLHAALPCGLLAIIQATLWFKAAEQPTSKDSDSGLHDWVYGQRIVLKLLAIGALIISLSGPGFLTWFHHLLATAIFAFMANDCLRLVIRRNSVEHVWTAEAIIAACVGYLTWNGVISFGHGFGMFAVLGTGLLAWGIGSQASNSQRFAVLEHPLKLTGFWMPAATVLIGMGRHHWLMTPTWLGLNSLALMLAAGFYFWRGIEEQSKRWVVISAVVLNVALTMLWNELSWSDPQFFLIPLGLSVLGLVELIRRELPEQAVNPLRYAGALMILVSPTFHIVDGSWLHLFSLMAASVAMALLGMGMRIRALMYLGTGFLVADLLAMVIRGSVDHPSLLWISGIGLGMLVITLAAYCERHREHLLQRMRLVAAELDSWQ